MSQLESTIEYIGGFYLLSENEQEEYRRIRAYFAAINYVSKKED